MVSTILIWMLIWFGVLGILFFIRKRGISYVKHFYVPLLYYPLFSALVLIAFKERFLSILSGFSLLALIILGSVVILDFCVCYFARKYLKNPKELKRNPPAFMRMDYRYVISKYSELLFQQTMIILLVVILKEMVGNLAVVMALFGLVFGLVHVPLLLVEKKGLSLYYIGSSVFSGLIFPVLILTLESGFVYSYLLHNYFYTFMGVYYWIRHPD